MSPRSVPSVKQTGGGGFRYEDRVGAYLSAALLADRGPRQDLAPPERLDFQTEDQGWALDDLLWTMADGKRLAVSVKSSDQLGGATVDRAFVEAAWAELRGTSGSAFEPERDLVGLICPAPERETQTAVFDLIRWVRVQDAAVLERRLNTERAVNDAHRSLWASLACPDDDEQSPAELLARLRLLFLDLESPSSASAAQAIAWCREALGNPDQAEDLWQALTSLVSQRRPDGGMIDLSVLHADLATFPLRRHPRTAQDWETLARLSQANLETVHPRIGDLVEIVREELLGDLDRTTAGDAVALIGPSGSGKTVASKQWLDRERDEDALFLLPEDLEDLGPGGRLDRELTEVLAASAQPGTIVIDGLDRQFSAETFRQAAHVIRAALASPGWRVVVTAQEQEWGRVVDALRDANITPSWERVIATPFSDAEFAQAHARLDGLVALTKHERLGDALKRPKLLDVIVRASTAGDPIDDALQDEPSVARFFWDHGLGQGQNRAARVRVLLELGTTQADQLTSSIPLQDLDSVDPVSDLVREGICLEEENRISFAHDLYADWARYEVLLSRRKESLGAFLKDRATRPTWHPAIRLYAIDVLGREGADSWRVEMLEASQRAGGAVQDLFLDAPLFAADPAGSLEALWPVLSADDGALLQRFLRRFAHTATFAHPLAVRAVEDAAPDLATFAASRNRIPYPPLWPAVLRLLTTHADEVGLLAGELAARTVDLWLRATPADWPWRKEAAALALQLADSMLEACRKPHIYIAKEHSNEFWRAALAAAPDFPDEVRALLEELIPQRQASPGTSNDLLDEDEDDYLGRPSEEGVRALCLEADTLQPLMAADPSRAKEVLLRCLISPKKERFRRRSVTEGYGIKGAIGWSRPFWNQGPFLPFLQVAPEVAVDFILELVNETTVRYLGHRDQFYEEMGDEGETDHLSAVAIRFSEEEIRLWKGDGQTFIWYAGDSRPPNTVVSALMALEKWLLDKIEADEDVSPALRQILEGSESVAFAGLLIAVGYRKPALFLDQLNPLTSAVPFFAWERARKVQGDTHQRIGLGMEPHFIQRLVVEWLEMPHRKWELEAVVQQLMLSEPAFAEQLARDRARWEEEYDAEEQQLLGRLDPDNWREAEVDGRRVWQYEAPEHLQRASEDAMAELNQHMFWLQFPHQARRLIDSDDEVDADQIEQFWRDCRERLDGAGPEGVEEGLSTTADSRCALAALFVVRFRDWLCRHPEHEDWCRTTLLEAVRTPRKKAWFDSAEDSSDWRHDCFCADALPVLWAEKPEDAELRHGIATLATNYHYNTIARLHAAAARERERLGPDFDRLGHLAILVARSRVASREAQHLGEDEVKSTRQKLEDELNQFVSGDLAPEAPDFSLGAVREPKLRSRRRRMPGERTFDLHHVLAAWSWLPHFAEARDEDERQSWVEFFERAVSALAQRFDFDLETGERLGGHAYEYETSFLLQVLPPRILELPSEEEAARLWQPLLATGETGESWLGTFFAGWFIAGLAEEVDRDRFSARWREMLEFSERAWHGQSSSDAETNRRSILGMRSWWSGDVWTEDTAAVLEELAPFYGCWAKDGLSDEEGFRRFASFLRQPGARPLVEDGLTWLLGAEESLSRGYRWEETENELVSLLGAIAQRGDAFVRGDSPGGRAFRELLHRAAGRHNPHAMELQARLGRS